MQIVGLLAGNPAAAFPRPGAKALGMMGGAGAPGGGGGLSPATQGAPMAPGAAPAGEQHPGLALLQKLGGQGAHPALTQIVQGLFR